MPNRRFAGSRRNAEDRDYLALAFAGELKQPPQNSLKSTRTWNQKTPLD
jgi:hypothetical protein